MAIKTTFHFNCPHCKRDIKLEGGTLKLHEFKGLNRNGLFENHVTCPKCGKDKVFLNEPEGWKPGKPPKMTSLRVTDGWENPNKEGWGGFRCQACGRIHLLFGADHKKYTTDLGMNEQGYEVSYAVCPDCGSTHVDFRSTIFSDIYKEKQWKKEKELKEQREYEERRERWRQGEAKRAKIRKKLIAEGVPAEMLETR